MADENLSEETRSRRFLANGPGLTETMLDHVVDEVDDVDHVASRAGGGGCRRGVAG
jgi:hypothetical protein